MVVMPSVQSLINGLFANEFRVPFRSNLFILNLQYRIMEALTTGWFFVLGTVFASFMNVVAWRLPNKRTLLDSSQCPFCAKRIRLSDNVPILGWIWLGCRCRTCRLPISVRYPLVELVYGIAFLILFQVEVVTGASNVPFSRIYDFVGMDLMVWKPNWEVLRFYIYHCTLITILFTWTLVKIDRFETPPSLFLLTATIGIAMPVVWSHLQTVSLLEPRPEWLVEKTQFAASMMEGGIGLVAGMAIGLILELLAPVMTNEKDESVSHTLIWGAMLVGLFMGWQAIISTALIYALISFATSLLSQIFPAVARWPLIGNFSLATFIQICIWNWTLQWSYWPNPLANEYVFGVSVVAVLILCGLARLFQPKVVNREVVPFVADKFGFGEKVLLLGIDPAVPYLPVAMNEIELGEVENAADSESEIEVDAPEDGKVPDENSADSEDADGNNPDGEDAFDAGEQDK